MPSHDLASTEIIAVKSGELAPTKEQESFLSRWKSEMGFDYEMELGRILKSVARSVHMSNIVKAEILIKGAAAIKALNKKDGSAAAGGKGGNNTQVNVFTSDPTKQ